jgi:hypothetical protein
MGLPLFERTTAMNDEAREILATACDAVIVEMAKRRCQNYLDEGLTIDQAAERMRNEFVPEAREWRQEQISKFDLMHRTPPPTDAVN